MWIENALDIFLNLHIFSDAIKTKPSIPLLQHPRTNQAPITSLQRILPPMLGNRKRIRSKKRAALPAQKSERQGIFLCQLVRRIEKYHVEGSAFLSRPAQIPSHTPLFNPHRIPFKSQSGKVLSQHSQRRRRLIHKCYRLGAAAQRLNPHRAGTGI